MSNKKIIIESIDSKEKSIGFAINWLMGGYEPATVLEQITEISALQKVDDKIFELRENISGRVNEIKEKLKEGELTIEAACEEFSKIRTSVKNAIVRNEGFEKRIIEVVDKSVTESKTLYEINFLKYGKMAAKPVKMLGQKLAGKGAAIQKGVTKGLRNKKAIAAAKKGYKAKAGKMMTKVGKGISKHSGKIAAGTGVAALGAAGYAAGKKK
jgi:hypothetical protein